MSILDDHIPYIHMGGSGSEELSTIANRMFAWDKVVLKG